jgi:hypothetical protein
MNERIRELMEQAGLYDFVIESMGINEEMEKFAELIVRECINVCEPVFLDETYEDMSEFGKGLVEGQDVAVEKIKQHFGVEE